jgi:hypothetical protein
MTAEEIIAKMDQNEVWSSIRYTGVMTIQKGGRSARVKTFTAVSSGRDRAFIEFTNPGDRGTKYLKLDGDLWIKGAYAEEATKISGHLLRESMMGSDYSYEDTLDNEKIMDVYSAELTGEEEVSGVRCYRIELTAKTKQISYPKRTIWVDADRFIGRRVRYYALSGALLKELTVLEVRDIGGRPFPVKVRMEDKQRDNSWTVFEMRSVELDIPLDARIFSKQQLER